MFKTLINKFMNKADIGEPPYDYYLLAGLDEKDYPKYLEKGFYRQTGEELDLKNPKTFNQKIQWLKLYDSTPLKTRLTDKVLVRDWIKERIGGDYLKPVLWIGKTFDEIPFGELPDSFVIKCNNGCKWHFIIKNKKAFLEKERLYEIVKIRIENWLQQIFSFWAGFEMHYKNIIPQIIIEPLMLDNINEKPTEIEIYCFNGEPKIFQKIKYQEPWEVSIYDENYNNIDLRFMDIYRLVKEDADDNIKKAVSLSKELCGEFKLVRVDWLLYRNKLYFNEMTFTPFSGNYEFPDKSWNIKLGNMLNLK